jgi:hypothetical protein
VTNKEADKRKKAFFVENTHQGSLHRSHYPASWSDSLRHHQFGYTIFLSLMAKLRMKPSHFEHHLHTGEQKVEMMILIPKPLFTARTKPLSSSRIASPSLEAN